MKSEPKIPHLSGVSLEIIPWLEREGGKITLELNDLEFDVQEIRDLLDENDLNKPSEDIESC